jgi:hypothetical protein
MPFLVASLLFCSGCGALLLLGAGGAGGYMIRKGEKPEKQETSEIQSSAKNRLASLTESKAGQKVVLLGGSQ